MNRFEPIAIIGQGCVLPQAFSPEELWDIIYEGRSVISSPNPNYWRVSMEEILSEEGKDIIGKASTDKGGYIKGFDSIFNPDYFLIDSKLLSDLDPLFKWSLFAAQKALQQAGYFDLSGKKSEKADKKTGVILGNLSYPSDYFSRFFEETYLRRLFPDIKFSEKNTHPINRFMSGLPALFIKKGLGLEGAAFCLDAACSSSLYAIKLACDRLASGTENMIIAGGVNAADSLFLHIGFTALKAISPKGESRPFSRDASGLIPAEGAAVLLLKRFDNALRDNDKILGVIRGIGLSNDGRTGGFLLPSSDGQIKCMDLAFKASGLTPEDVSFIECHATGTQGGDSVEIESMKKVFGKKKNGDIVISSLKANLGHSITTSGAAAMIKVLCCLKHNIRPQTPNAFPLSEKIVSPFKVLEKPEEWQAKRKTACVSGFGFGGNNAHIIVEKWDEESKIWTNSAKSKIAKKTKKKVALVGTGIRIGKIQNSGEFLEFLLTGKEPEKINLKNLKKLKFRSSELVFPPKDLESALGQQLILLDVIKEALSFTKKIAPIETGVFIGMGTDAEVNRYGLRWRLKDFLIKSGIKIDLKWMAEAEKSVVETLQTSGVIGNMPNIAANRINAKYDFQGQSFTISCEELSGDRALEIAIDAITRGEIETAVVGAVDLSKEKIHEIAAEKIIGEKYKKGADAAVIFILKDLEKAEKDKDEIIAVFDEDFKRDDFCDILLKNDEG